MQLNDILEENSIKAISDKTKISEENLEYLMALEFDALSKVKTLGFISIMEREYKADLGAVKTQAMEYYGQSGDSHLFPIGQPVMDEQRGKPKGLILFILLLLGISSWYFFTQFDKKHLNDLIPFMDDKTIESFIKNDKEPKEETTPKMSEDIIIIKADTSVKQDLETQEARNSDTVQEEDNSTERQ